MGSPNDDSEDRENKEAPREANEHLSSWLATISCLVLSNPHCRPAPRRAWHGSRPDKMRRTSTRAFEISHLAHDACPPERLTVQARLPVRT
jgi:hypothetical protein